ncbi:BTAD domain-containing putative transcriptional regulator [Catenulispora subtropica]|uniref:OmpR/PhoB-type domain-containing protein n=1 Tax=Catenulispora subtropica TaxID=450798 RepID=A0ABN2T1D9_9ACTN
MATDAADEGKTMHWAILGPFLVSDGSGREVRIPGSRLRTLLAALLLRANQPVSVDELCDILWDGEPPPDAARTVRVYVLRLRRALGPDADRIVTRPPGYLCRVDLGELDTLAFETACGRAAVALAGGSWAVAASAAERAMRMWRGQPLLDVPSQRLHDACVPRLEQLRLQVLDDRCEADLALGRHGDVIPRLRELVKRHPSYERFHAQLMVALEGNGRRAEALTVYQQARQTLAAELGTEPGAELRALYRRILDGGTRTAAGNGALRRAAPVVPLESLHAIDEAVERASLTLAAFVSGHFERLWSWFSAPLAEVATVEHLTGAREDLERQMGAFQQMSGMPRVRRAGLRTVVEIPLIYETARMKGRVTLDAEGKVLGLYVLKVDEH